MLLSIAPTMTKVHFANTDSADMYYMVRSRIPDPFFFIDTGEKKTAILNALEIDAFKEHSSGIEAVALEPFWEEAKKIEGEGSGLCKLALVVFQQYQLIHTTVEVARSFPLDVADYVRARGASLVVVYPFVPARAKKSAEELSYMRENLNSTKEAFEYIEHVLRESKIEGDVLVYRGNTLASEYLKAEVEKLLFEKGMDDVEGMIISSGLQSSMPHHKGSGVIQANTSIICDLFFRNRHNRYFADMTRTYVKGTPSKKLRDMYDAVQKAQDAAFAAIRPGISAKSAYEESAKAIRDAGFDVGDRGYIHSLGHGLGLELHEALSAGPNSNDVLESGHVLTVEPGLYYQDEGGVRIEDVIVVTEGGFENLTNYPREFVVE